MRKKRKKERKKENNSSDKIKTNTERSFGNFAPLFIVCRPKTEHIYQIFIKIFSKLLPIRIMVIDF